MNINDLYLLAVTGIAALVSISTVYKLFKDHARLTSEDLGDEDRAFAWRVVIFLIFPLVTFLDLRATTVVTELLGGYMKESSYGWMWYHAIPAGLTNNQALVMALSGEVVTTTFALLLIPALFFRPHPFLATVIGYASVFILALNFIGDPILSLAGIGNMRWEVVRIAGSAEQLQALVIAHVVAAAVLLIALKNNGIRL
ncbi:MAG TPA: hypothetical protein V6C72_08640, partial [Chroococcales cyanobacterium]